MAAKEKKTALAKKEESALAVQGDDFYDPSDESTSDERKIPFVKIAQRTADEVSSKKAEVGDLLTSTGINLGQWAEFTPLWYSRQAALFDDNNKLVCKSTDGVTGNVYGLCSDCEFDYNQWDGKTPPKCTKMGMFPALLHRCERFDEEVDCLSLGIMAFNFAKSSFDAAKQLITAHDLSQRPYYSSRWKVSTHDKVFPRGTARVADLDFVQVNEREFMLSCDKAARKWSGATIEVSDLEGDGMTPETPTEEKVDDEGLPF